MDHVIPITVPHSPPSPTAKPTRSTLKRQHSLSDQNEEESDEPTAKKKRGITFDSVTVFYFPRAQGFTCVPSQVIPT
jgi:cysteine/serine-rich nuclear protein